MYRNFSRSQNSLQSVVAVSARDAWAVGETRTHAIVMRWQKGRWRRWPLAASMSADFFPVDVAASSASNVWAFGSDSRSATGRAIRWDGSRWAPVQLPVNVTTDTAVVLSPTDVWITSSVGSCTNGQCTENLYRWNGINWIPYPVGASIDQLSASGPRDVWAIGEASINSSTHNFTPVAYRWNGTGWARVASMPHPRAGGTTAIDVVSPRDVWASFWLARNSKVAALHWNGHHWRRLTAPHSVAAVPEPLAAGKDIWFGSSALWNGHRWRGIGPGNLIPRRGGNLNLPAMAAIPGRPAVWGAGGASRTPNGSTSDAIIGVYGRLP